MLHQRRSNVVFNVFALGLLLFNGWGRSTPAPAPVDPEAWLDETIDIKQFAPGGSLIVHFNMPMDVNNSPEPMLSWPSLDGSSNWDSSHTTLTFSPAKILNSNAAYLFFLNPALHSANGRTLKHLPEWQVFTSGEPQILKVSPPAGDLDRRYGEIDISFDQNMATSLDDGMVSIEPFTQTTLNWKTQRILQIKLEKPFDFGQRYKLTMHKGLSTAKGGYLEDDYVWSYQQLPVKVQVESISDKEIKVVFNYKLSRRKTGLDFSVSPTLEGRWVWGSPSQVVFKSLLPIPANEFYSVHYPALVDVNGFEIAAPSVRFSGLSPVHLLADTDYKTKKYNILRYDGYRGKPYYLTNEDLDAIRLEFFVPVDHASAEKAFSLAPSVPGVIRWEKDQQDRDILVYKIDQFLQRGTQYSIQLNPTITNAQGQTIMVLPFTEKLGVNDYSDTFPSFGALGHNIQTLDASGARRLQYAPGKAHAVFSAYRFDLNDFVKLYPQYRSRSSSGIPNIPIPAQNKPAAVWDASSMKIETGATITETPLPSSLKPGLYVVNVNVGNTLHDQMFIVLTNNTLVVKDNDHKLTAWVTDINGQAVEKAEIQVYNTKGEKVREGQSDANGLYSVAMPSGETTMLMFARVHKPGKPEDITAVGLNFASDANGQDWWFSGYSSWRSMGSYLYYEEPGSDLSPGQPILAYAYTERPIYRPGQTVNFKAIFRQDDDMRYSLPEAGTPVKVRVQDARKNNLQTLILTTNEFGSVNGNFVVPDGAGLGKYTIEMEINGVTSSASFRVDDYRKPDYQVSVTSLQPEKQGRYVRGEDVKVQVHVAYYFGEPLSGAKLHLETVYDYSTTAPEQSQEIMTDSQGDATVMIKAPDLDGPYDLWHTGMRRVLLQITADDGSHQNVAGHYYFDEYPAVDQITLDTGGYYAQPGESIMVNIHDADIFGQPVVERALTLGIRPWNRTEFKFDDAIQRMPVKTDGEGNASLQLTLNTGFYKLSLTGLDTLGNTIERNQTIYVFKDNTDWFQRQRGNPLAISSDREHYEPGEKVRLAIESTFSGPAWLTFERGSVIDSQQIVLTAPLTIIETNLIPEYAPNVFITVNAWQTASKGVYRDNYPDPSESSADSYLRIARTLVWVDASAKALDIKITPNKQTYLPGETVQAKIQVNDAAGRPVVAEFSLAVVDESIFALAKDNALPIFDAFYSPRGLAVKTYDTMVPWRFIYQPDFGGGSEGEPPDLRVDFLDTSTWMPVIKTDDTGQSNVQFTLPDNITRWRVTVKAVTREHQVGQAQTYVETRKDLFVRPILPRIVTQGDSATLTAFVHNYSSVSQEAQVRLDAPGLDLIDAADQQISLQPGETKVVAWQVRVTTGKPTQVTVRVQAGQAQDAVQLPLNIRPAVTQEIQTQSGQFSETTTLRLNLPQVDKENSQVTLTLNRSLAGTILNGLEFLTGYPYGCVEQTMSRALPNAVVAHATSELGLDNAGLQSELPSLIQASLIKLYGLQHDDGGWGWWYDDRSDVYQTAWVLFGLSVIDDSGYTVEPGVINNTVDFLKKYSDADPRIQAYGLYSLARSGQGDREETLRMAQESGDKLDPFSQAAIALALHELGEEKQARTILALLEKSALKQDDYVSWPQSDQSDEDGEYHSKTMSSSLRTTALVLQAYVEIDPQNPLIPGMVRYLASRRKGMEGWGTTNETSYTILALTEYLVSQNKMQGAVPYRVLLNGRPLAEGILNAEQVHVSLDVPLIEMSLGANDLRLETEGKAPVYFDLTMQYSRLQLSPQALGNIKVSRRYVSPQNKTAINNLEANQLVRVELTVHLPKDISYFALEDYLPGGLEALNERLNADQESVGRGDYESFFWNDYGYNYKEIRGDRVVFFITSLSRGQYTFTYMARATIPGQFVALPAQAYAMYDLSLWGRSDGAAIQVGR